VVSLRRQPLSACDARQLVDVLGDHRRDLVQFYKGLPLRSPARAALKTLLDQQAEIATIITGDRDYFAGKPHTMDVAHPKGGSSR
jgi:hypothetical protein